MDLKERNSQKLEEKQIQYTEVIRINMQNVDLKNKIREKRRTRAKIKEE